MNDSKWFVKSKRMQGSIGMLIVALGTVLGVDPELLDQTSTQIAAAVGFVAWCWNFYGSIVAKEKVTVRKN